MDLLSTRWLSDEMEMNSSAFSHEWENMSSLDNESFDFKPFNSSHNITKYDYNQNSTNNYVSQLNTKSSSNNSSSSSTIISFGNNESPKVTRENNNKALETKKAFSSSTSSFVHHEISNLENIYAPSEYGEMKRGVARTPEQAQDHVLAERKRREKMTQKFVVLSTLIPGLKKLDKATVLGDAINYIKELQGRVKELEIEVKGNHKEEAMTTRSVKRPKLISSYDNEASSYDENNDDNCISSVVIGDLSSDDEISPEIKVTASEGNLMIRVYCKNQIGVIKEVMGEIEKHNLSLVSSSVMPFGLNNLHMAIVAQVDVECEVTPKDLADNIKRSILDLV